MKKEYVKMVTAVIMALIFMMGIMPCSNANAANTGTFNVMSANVAGLPGILSSSNPKANTIQMGSFLNNYDIVSVQEDFAYHRDLISKVKHPYLTEHSGNVPYGDGMNFMSNFELNNITRVKWKDSYGFIKDGADQMTPKGILYSSVKISDGYYIDVYDIHTDAGDDEGSYAARRSNMNQLGKMIREYSEGKAVIVIGDTNSRYTRAQDNFETAVLKTCGLRDAWIEKKCGGIIPKDGAALMDSSNRNSSSNEVVDKIWYRSGQDVTLKAVSYDLLTNFTDGNGNQLSDHYPITSTFSFSLNKNIRTSELYGGDRGSIFSFLTKMGNNFPKAVSIRAANRLDAISFTYAHAAVSAGGNGGDLKTMKLADGEYITSVQVSKAKASWNSSYRISYIKIQTNFGNILEGGKQGALYTYTAPSGYGVAGIYGYSGDEIDSIGVIYRKFHN
jgi:endonuclease/exonuclease/phosphatase family metal-dependent hydrolase